MRVSATGVGERERRGKLRRFRGLVKGEEGKAAWSREKRAREGEGRCRRRVRVCERERAGVGVGFVFRAN